jgi:hypothetical protein
VVRGVAGGETLIDAFKGDIFITATGMNHVSVVGDADTRRWARKEAPPDPGGASFQFTSDPVPESASKAHGIRTRT